MENTPRQSKSRKCAASSAGAPNNAKQAHTTWTLKLEGTDNNTNNMMARKRAVSSTNTINAPKRVHTTVEHDIEGTDAEESTAPDNNPTDYMSDVDDKKDDDPIAKYEKMKETFQKVYKVCSHLLVYDLTIQLFI